MWMLHVLFFIIGVKLVYNVVLVSPEQWSKSAMCIHIAFPSWTSFPVHPLIPPPLGHRRALSWAPSAVQQLLYSSYASFIFYARWCVRVSVSSLPVHPSLSPAMCTHPFSMSASLFSPWKWVHLSHFSRFHRDVFIPLLGIYPAETIEDTCTPVFIAALSTIARPWKQPTVQRQINGK